MNSLSTLDNYKHLIKHQSTLQLVNGSICLVYLRYLTHTRTVIGGHLHLLAGVPVVYVHVPHKHQSMSHLQKVPICIECGPFVVMYARCTPGFGGYIEIS